MHQRYKLTRNFLARLGAALMLFVLSAQAPAKTGAAFPGINTDKVAIKSVEPFHFFYTRIRTEKHNLADKIKTKAMDMGAKLAKRSSAKINGPLMLSYQSDTQQNTQQVTADIGFPVSKRTKRLPPYKYRKAKAFDCASLTFTGPPAELEQQWRHLYRFAREQQLSLNGESRMLLLSGEENGNIHVELQLGIKARAKAKARQENPNPGNNGSITARLLPESTTGK
ncbi:GyrI-like domain-containing protein [Thalassomonas viridans]|uniref:GyrI-like domain-containing protein n=1 Tax=Thalassomonas viridans TaxID=137584 RepID=A0AAE9Z150_9GAMM|nr:GyrI-like domain-containing protein [Thalassomonas viridans]WDE04297.1 GyrI-like domain-containing protein [Thalassomonas viridans]